MTGKDSGERLWPFPMDPDFDSALKSSVADVLQCTVSSEADHILAAVFLKKFVNKDVHWVHLDLCPAAKPGRFPARKVGFNLVKARTERMIKTGMKTPFCVCCACANMRAHRRIRACDDRGDWLRSSCQFVSCS